MGNKLQQRLHQNSFESDQQEAILNVLVCADYLNKRMETVCDGHGITLGQYNVLRILRGVHPEGHARCDIIGRMIQQAPDVTRLIDRLERSGYVSRGASQSDGRLSITTITERGIALLLNMEPEVRAIHLTIAERISDRDARLLSKLCERIYGV